jgi:predicted secreted hydrolase
MKRLLSRIAVLGLLLASLADHRVCAETPPVKQTEGSSPAVNGPFSYPLSIGDLSFPKDEGKHSPFEWPMTLVEWHAHYAHLTAEDGSRYFLFATFVTFDPVEQMIGGKFPHTILTLVDVTNGKTYHHRDMERLKSIASGHADVQTTNGDYFTWKGEDKPFEYDFHVAWRNSLGDISLTTALKMTKPPLAVNGSGYIKLPKGDSGYYSQTRLETKGELTINGVRKKVSGIQWIDRQWLGMSFAANLDYYYDWWALQLNNNEEAILFRIKDFESNSVAMSVLEINHADGKREHVDGFVLSDLPSGWQLSAPSAGWELKIVPACKGQGIWQSCDITGTIHGKPVAGLAAAELARSALEEFRQLLPPSTTPQAGAGGVESGRATPTSPR